MKYEKGLWLGINSVYHESSAALISENRVVAAIEEERLSRIKHAKSASIEGTVQLPYLAIDYCLDTANVTLDDVTGIAYAFSPQLRLEGTISRDEAIDIEPGTFGSTLGEQRFFALNKMVPQLLERRFDQCMEGRFHFLSHHLCHLASAFYPSPFESAAVLSMDGIGETVSTTIAHGTPEGLRTILELSYPNSLGFLWEKLTAFLGFKSNSDECKIMGLAAYGDPSIYRDAFSALLSHTDAGFSLANDVLLFRTHNAWDGLEQLLGPRRLSHEPLLFKGSDRRHADIAASLQDVTSKAVLHLAKLAQEQTGETKLAIAGGVALNCVANGEIARSGIFDDVWIQPAAHDAGTALGAAYILAQKSGALHRPHHFSVYAGPRYDQEQIDEALRKYRIDDRVEILDDESLFSEIASRLANGEVIAWFQGQLEWGPRALGNRSILADPRCPDMRDRLNKVIKHREDFRPFCPSVLAEEASEWFDLASAAIAATDYMLVTYDVHEHQRSRVPGITHVDGTSRLQMVRQQHNPRYYSLIRAFFERTGVPLVLNTSFNDREPIVCSPEDAIRCFLRSSMDCLVLENRVISRKDD